MTSSLGSGSSSGGSNSGILVETTRPTDCQMLYLKDVCVLLIKEKILTVQHDKH